MHTVQESKLFVSAKELVRNALQTVNYHNEERHSEIRHENHLYTESMFRELLVLERKRTERSRQPFMLLRVDVSKIPDDEFGRNAFDCMIQSIGAVTRSTDVKGWFLGGKIVGVIITDYCATAEKNIVEKLGASVFEGLATEFHKDVALTHDVFPDGAVTSSVNSVELNRMLYDKLAAKNQILSGCFVCKRIIDIIGSLFGILLFLPFFLIVPLLIKCTSKGPVLFVQKRVGRFGKTFRCLKFRTMKPVHDESVHKEFIRKFIANSAGVKVDGGTNQFKMANDPRITAIGKFLRKTSLDELPQFINVLFGTMSLVGPRPAIPYEVEEYDAWHCRRVLEVKPGITGIWQVKGRSRTTFESMVRMDIQYINTWSPVLDLRLIISTPIAMVLAKGAC